MPVIVNAYEPLVAVGMCLDLRFQDSACEI